MVRTASITNTAGSEEDEISTEESRPVKFTTSIDVIEPQHISTTETSLSVIDIDSDSSSHESPQISDSSNLEVSSEVPLNSDAAESGICVQSEGNMEISCLQLQDIPNETESMNQTTLNEATSLAPYPSEISNISQEESLDMQHLIQRSPKAVPVNHEVLEPSNHSTAEDLSPVEVPNMDFENPCLSNTAMETLPLSISSNPSSPALQVQQTILSPASSLNEINTEGRAYQDTVHFSLKDKAVLIEAHINFFGGLECLNIGLERPRFQLLLEACNSEDLFYVMLHQFFVQWDFNFQEILRIPDAPNIKILQSGFAIIGKLIHENDLMDPNHKRWFAEFPCPIANLWQMSDKCRKTCIDVFECMKKLSNNWYDMMQDCKNRQFPFLVDELVVKLGVFSPIFQRVLFTATRRSLGIQDEESAAAMMRVFERNQTEYWQLLDQSSPMTRATAKELQDRKISLMQTYRYLHALYKQRYPTHVSNLMGSAARSAGTTPINAPYLEARVSGTMTVAQSHRNLHHQAQSGQRPSSWDSSNQPQQVVQVSQALVIPSNNIIPSTDQAYRNTQQTIPGSVSLHRISANTPPQNSSHTSPQSTSPTIRQPYDPRQCLFVGGSTPGSISRQNNSQSVVHQQMRTQSSPRIIGYRQDNRFQQQTQKHPQRKGQKQTQLQTYYQQKPDQLRQSHQTHQSHQPYQPHPPHQSQPHQPHQPQLHQPHQPQPQPQLHQPQPHQPQTLQPQPHQPQPHQSYQPYQLHQSHQSGYSGQPLLTPPSIQTRPPQQNQQFQQSILHRNRLINFQPTVSNHNSQTRLSISNPADLQQSSLSRNFNSSGTLTRAQYQAASNNINISHNEPLPSATYPPAISLVSSNVVTNNPVETYFSDKIKADINLYNQTTILNRSIVPPRNWVHSHNVFGLCRPELNALHQALLRSPQLIPSSLPTQDEEKNLALKYYQALKDFALPPTVISENTLSNFEFSVSEIEIGKIPLDSISLNGNVPFREFQKGSLQYRLRCVQTGKLESSLSISEWTVKDTTWPENTCLDINNRHLEIRRKAHHGKDLPIDITQHVLKHGTTTPNKLTLSITRAQSNLKEHNYFLAVEIVEILEHSQILEMCQQKNRLPISHTLEKIKNTLAPPAADTDDDFELMISEISINLADPFTSNTFEIPARGATCLHRECFDLETFLLTRVKKSKRPNQPCMVDVWKCPLCGRDARPWQLQIDGYMESIRNVLAEQGNLDVVKSIRVEPDGTWHPKREKRKSLESSESRLLRNNRGIIERKAKQKKPPEIITLDDD